MWAAGSTPSFSLRALVGTSVLLTLQSRVWGSRLNAFARTYGLTQPANPMGSHVGSGLARPSGSRVGRQTHSPFGLAVWQQAQRLRLPLRIRSTRAEPYELACWQRASSPFELACGQRTRVCEWETVLLALRPRVWVAGSTTSLSLTGSLNPQTLGARV